MFNFLKKKKQKLDEIDENFIRKSQENFIRQHDYKIKHDPKYRKSVEKSNAFFKADREAREKAGLVNKIGSYTFTCPNCGTKCKGEWLRFDSTGNLHGHTDCFNCNIHLIV